MQPLVQMPADRIRALDGVLTDIDDTLTTDGRLTAAAYAAMERLRADDLRVIPITGRPAGWCDHIARMWPVDGVVGENGAFWFRYRHDERRMVRGYADDAAARGEKRAALDAIRETVLREVPGAAVAADQAYREADLAIDFREDVAPLPREAIERIVEIFAAAGATARVSSIHVNGWFGDYDKLSATRGFLRACFDVDLDAVRERYAFAGDSPNDAPMFGFFPLSVGVANVVELRDLAEHLPAYVTNAASGAGFVELADHLLAVRARPRRTPPGTR